MKILFSTTNLAIKGWRWVFIIAGIPGIVISIIMFITVKQPNKIDKKNEHTDKTPIIHEEENTEAENNENKSINRT